MALNNKYKIRKINAGIGNAGIGFVIIPIDVDRGKYIENCYSTCKIDISGGNLYGVLSDVLVDKKALQEIRFPAGTDDDLYGSPVFWVLDEYNQVPIVVSVFNEDNEYFDLIEGQARIFKQSGNKSVDVSFDAQNSMYSLILIGDADTPSTYNIKVVSENQNSKINIYTDDELNVEAGKIVSAISGEEVRVKVIKDENTSAELAYKIEDGLSYKDEFENEIQANNDGVRIKTDKDIKLEADSKVIHNGGSQPMVLGDTLKQLLENLITAITTITVTCPTSGGTSSTPINAPAFEVIKNQLENVLSQKSKLE